MSFAGWTASARSSSAAARRGRGRGARRAGLHAADDGARAGRRAGHRRGRGRGADRAARPRRRARRGPARRVRGDRIVALGGGRVVDVAKALVAANGGRAMAVPTTLSRRRDDAHAPARGAASTSPPRACGPRSWSSIRRSPPPSRRRSSPRARSTRSGTRSRRRAWCNANPVATLAAHEAARLLRAGWAGDEPDRDTLALGSLLAGYALDNTGLALHHVLAQTLVRARRRRARPGERGDAPAHDRRARVALPGRRSRRSTRPSARTSSRSRCAIRAHTGAGGLRELGVDPAVLPECADAAAARPQLELTPPAADRAEILALYESAL